MALCYYIMQLQCYYIVFNKMSFFSVAHPGGQCPDLAAVPVTDLVAGSPAAPSPSPNPPKVGPSSPCPSARQTPKEVPEAPGRLPGLGPETGVLPSPDPGKPSLKALIVLCTGWPTHKRHSIVKSVTHVGTLPIKYPSQLIDTSTLLILIY